MTFYSPIELHNYTTEKCNGIHFSFKKLNKRYFYDTFERKLDNDIFVLKNEMCFYLAMLNIHANSQCIFFFFSCYQRRIFFRCKFDLPSVNSELHEYDFWPISLFYFLICYHTVQDNTSIMFFLFLFPFFF